MKWSTCILLCADESYYVGHTKDVNQRLATHNAGMGAEYTAKRKPVTLAYLEEHPSKEKATSREIQIKKWSRAKKQALIDGDTVQLHELAKRRT